MNLTTWAVFILVVLATITDLRNRRVPNWLTLPFLAAGVAAAIARHGMRGLSHSLAGMALAAAVAGILCYLHGMGMGDLKLCAAVGAWIGPEQMTIALVVTGLAGGGLALLWALFHGSLRESVAGSGDLLSGFWKRGIRPHPELVLENPAARTMPYAPAIAIGAMFSFLTI